MSGFNLPPGVGVNDIPGNEPVAVAAPRGHRRKFGKHHRVMLSGATVDVSTSRQAKTWRGKSLSLGLLMDQVFAFAKRKGFKPERKRKTATK